MQKSAHTHKTPARPQPGHFDAAGDKGQKYEPFWTATAHGELRSRVRVLKADQKR